MSLPKIGQTFGGRDHTTVMHADKKIRKEMAERRRIYDQVQELTSRIKQRAAPVAHPLPPNDFGASAHCGRPCVVISECPKHAYAREAAKARTRASPKSRKLFVHKEFPHGVGRLPTVPTDPSPATTRIRSTSRPQVIHSESTPLSTLIPQVAHILCTARAESLGRAISAPVRAPPDPGYNSPHTWGQPWGQPGQSVDGSGRRPKPSTEARVCPQVHHHGSPHARKRSDLRERPQSTQSTTLTTATAFRSLLREKKQKQAEAEVWGQPRDRVVMSTNSRGGRGDGGAPRRPNVDACTWSVLRPLNAEGGPAGGGSRSLPSVNEAWPEPDTGLGRRKDARMKIRVERDGLADAVAWVAQKPPLPASGAGAGRCPARRRFRTATPTR